MTLKSVSSLKEMGILIIFYKINEPLMLRIENFVLCVFLFWICLSLSFYLGNNVHDFRCRILLSYDTAINN